MRVFQSVQWQKCTFCTLKCKCTGLLARFCAKNSFIAIFGGQNQSIFLHPASLCTFLLKNNTFYFLAWLRPKFLKKVQDLKKTSVVVKLKQKNKKTALDACLSKHAIFGRHASSFIQFCKTESYSMRVCQIKQNCLKKHMICFARLASSSERQSKSGYLLIPDSQILYFSKSWKAKDQPDQVPGPGLGLKFWPKRQWCTWPVVPADVLPTSSPGSQVLAKLEKVIKIT